MTSVASRYTIAGRCARTTGLKALLDQWRAMGIVYVEPTQEMIDRQFAERRAWVARLECAWPGEHFSCLCLTGRSMYRVGEACPVCHMDSFNEIPYTGTRPLVWTDDFGSNGPAGGQWVSHFNGRADTFAGMGFAGGGMATGKATDKHFRRKVKS